MIFDKMNKKHMIKESFDNLPTGIIFSKMNGVILLANALMYDLYRQLSDGALQSAHAFWYSLTEEHDQIELLEADDAPTLRFADNKIYRFSKHLIEINHEQIIQIEAVDISALHKLKQTHLKKHKKLVELRQKMVETKANLESVTRQEEVLDAKFKIHNTMGMGLTTIRRYLSTGQGNLDKELTMWQRSIELLINSDAFVQQGFFEGLQQAAQSVGIMLDIVGKWPDEQLEIEKVLIGVGRECLINACLHGDAKHMQIVISETKTAYQITFNNDGKTSKKPIRSGGGFMSIKKTLETVDGSFEVVQTPKFSIVLAIPKIFKG